MEAYEMQAFIDVITEYFEQISGEAAEMGVPYIQVSSKDNLQFTGIIGVSGIRRGGIYFTATREMLRELAVLLVGESYDDQDIKDLAGEITNTIAGNMRKTFGSEYIISVPLIIQESLEEITHGLMPPVFMIPIQWRSNRALLAIGLE